MSRTLMWFSNICFIPAGTDVQFSWCRSQWWFRTSLIFRGQDIAFSPTGKRAPSWICIRAGPYLSTIALNFLFLFLPLPRLTDLVAVSQNMKTKSIVSNKIVCKVSTTKAKNKKGYVYLQEAMCAGPCDSEPGAGCASAGDSMPTDGHTGLAS